jgi:hypothetical protein
VGDTLQLLSSTLASPPCKPQHLTASSRLLLLSTSVLSWSPRNSICPMFSVIWICKPGRRGGGQRASTPPHSSQLHLSQPQCPPGNQKRRARVKVRTHLDSVHLGLHRCEPGELLWVRRDLIDQGLDALAVRAHGSRGKSRDVSPQACMEALTPMQEMPLTSMLSSAGPPLEAAAAESCSQSRSQSSLPACQGRPWA